MKMHVRKATDDDKKQTATWGIWAKEPSEFPWEYDEKETCYIMEGHATVTDHEGNKVEFRPGDVVVFEEGLECTWNIHETIKKRYYFG